MMIYQERKTRQNSCALPLAVHSDCILLCEENKEVFCSDIVHVNFEYSFVGLNLVAFSSEEGVIRHDCDLYAVV